VHCMLDLCLDATLTLTLASCSLFRAGEVSRALVVECIRRYSADNITAVVIQL
jgi:hypothetical protein